MMEKLLIGIAVFGISCLCGQTAMALTSDQVLALKKAGVDDKTIQLMIRQEMAAKQNLPDEAGTREIKDRDGNTVIIYSTGSRPRHFDAAEKEKLDKAWEMLRHVIIDGRK